MGKIVDVKKLEGDKHIYKVLVTPEEFVALGGNLKNVHFFSFDDFTAKAQVMESAVKKSTKYFTIPRELADSILRKRNAYQQLSGSCISMDLDRNVFFIYIIKKPYTS